MIFLYAASASFICYSFFIISSAIKLRGEENEYSESAPQQVSIIVPFRNEAKNVPRLCQSLFNLETANFTVEFLFIDDHSEDNSLEVLQQLIKSRTDTKILALPNNLHGKKKALQYATQHSKGKWLALTDADCILPKSWLAHTLSGNINDTDTGLVIGLVDYLGSNKKFIHAFQRFDLLGMIGLSVGLAKIGWPSICNGANLFVKKEVFQKSQDALGKHPSGDDVFLLHYCKANNIPIRVCLSSKTVVKTKFEENLKEVINQRLRWASKSKNYKDSFTLLLGGIVLLTSITMLLSFILIVKGEVLFFSILWCVKLLLDFTLLYQIRQLHKARWSLFWFPVVSIIYPFYIVTGSIIANLLPFTWKNRRFK